MWHHWLAGVLNLEKTNMGSSNINNGQPELHAGHQLMKVLIIDDELDICYLLSGILNRKKLTTSYVNTLGDARTALDADIPDLVFLDNHLPDGYGLDFISHIKLTYPDTKIIMITAHDSAEERNRAYREGVDLFLSKPFSRELIYETLDRVS
jgi:two-component system OmpR family response regulator